MAPNVDQDSVSEQIYEDSYFNLTDGGINFDEIASLALADIPDFDHSKLMEGHCLDVEMAPAAPQAVVVPASANPDNSALFTTFSDMQPAFADLQDMQPVSPEMFLLPDSNTTLLQTVPDASFLQPVLDASFLQPSSPGTLLQPVSPGTMLEPPSPGTFLQPSSPGASLSSDCSSSEPEYLKPQPAQYINVKPAVVVPVLSAPSVKLEVPSVKLEVPSVEEAADMPKKRGRKPKYPKGMAPPRRSRPRKQKVYEMGPLSNEAEEKKRKNAINAKLHRDKQKNIRDSLSIKLKEVTAERDGLLKLVEQLKQSEASLRQALSKGM